MLLTIDIGNTNITMGAYSGDELTFVARLATDRTRTEDQYAIDLRNILILNDAHSSVFRGAAISSVVPELTGAVSRAVEKLFKITPLILSPGTKTGLHIATDNPAEVGADLVAGAVAALRHYPLPCLVMDLGTATKISVLNEQGVFCGCTIAPGVVISLEALSARTSQLPSISFSAPRAVVGKNTIDSMQSGIVYGIASMLDGMCDKIEEELGQKVKSIVATGGLSTDIVKNCRREVIPNPSLILEGLKIIYEKNKVK